MSNKLGRRPFLIFRNYPSYYFGGNPLAGRAEIFLCLSGLLVILAFNFSLQLSSIGVLFVHVLLCPARRPPS